MSVKVFDRALYQREYLNYDVTNNEEILGMCLVLASNVLLHFLIFENFRQINRNYYIGRIDAPGKMICLNFNLLVSVQLRIFDAVYLIVGCQWSQFTKLQDGDVYFNVAIHTYTQLTYLQLQNIVLLLAAKMWIKIFSCKYDDDQWPTHMKVFWYFLTSAYVLTFVTLLMIAIVNLISNDVCKQIMQVFVWAGTLMSAISFSIGCWAVLQNFDGIAIPSLNRHAKKIKFIGSFMVTCQVIRVVFNIWTSFNAELLISFKAGGPHELLPLPDNSPNWAAFLTCYLWSCDFLPTLFMIIIFSPSRYRYRKLGEFLESENGQSLACLRQPQTW